MKRTLLVVALTALFTPVLADTITNCPEGTVNCSTQNMGDEYSSADNSQSSATQSNPSSTSNSSASDITIDPKIQQSNNAVDQSGNRVTGTATGGAASSTGNRNDQSNFGNASSNSGGNILGNDSSNTNTAKGGSASVGNTTSGDVTGTNTQSQGIKDSGNSSSSSTNANVNSIEGAQSQSTTSKSGVAGSGNSANKTTTAVDASDRSSQTYVDKSQYIHVPTHQAPPASLVVPGQVAITQTQCGPLTAVQSTRVAGITMGWIFNRHVDLGEDDRLIPYRDPHTGTNELFFRRPMPDGTTAVIGHQVHFAQTVLSVSAGKNFSLAGGGSQWGSGGAGTTSGMQRLVTKIDLIPCIYGIQRTAAPRNIRK